MSDPFFITFAKAGWRGAHDLQQSGVLSEAMAMARDESVALQSAPLPNTPSRGWSR